jgi:serine/threonine-protein kinase HipA
VPADPHDVDYLDGRSRRIFVSMWRRGAFAPCGIIEFNSAEQRGQFAYLGTYDGPPVDPIHLDYRGEGKRVFRINAAINPDLLHRVWWDYLPGAWGNQVLQAEYPNLRAMRASEKLHWFGTRTVGALAFFVRQFADENPVHGIDRLEEIRRQSIDLFLRRIERLGLSPQGIDSLTAYGGARPKCMFADRAGGQWLAKFNVDTDPYNFAHVEHGLALLAKRCGIHAVDTKALPISPGADVLFVRRYDRCGTRRPHRISALALMREDTVKAQNEGDYSMIFQLLPKICCDPEAAREELLRRMFFNLALNNTDDHLKNFEFLQDEDTGCWSLSPCFDVTVDPYPNQHVTAVFGLQRPSLGNDTLEHILRYSDLDRGEVFRIRNEIVSEVRHWREFLTEAGVGEASLAKLNRGIEFGLRDAPKHHRSNHALGHPA